MDFIYQYQLHYIFRVIVAGICGIIIGYERKNRAKEAGLRTHCIVACASALIMVLSKYGFSDIVGGPSTLRADGTRIAAQVVSGIGFLGAGMIFVQKNTVKGLTTAAGVWATSGIGMTIGAGMYIVGIATTFILLAVQIILHKNMKFNEMPMNKRINVYSVSDADFQHKYMDYLHEIGVIVNDVSVKRKEEGGGLAYSFDIEVLPSVTEGQLLSAFEYKASIESVR